MGRRVLYADASVGGFAFLQFVKMIDL